MSSFDFEEGLIIQADVQLNEYEPDKNRSIRWIDENANQFAVFYHNDSAKICMVALVNGYEVVNQCVDIDSTEWLGQDDLMHELSMEMVGDELLGLRDEKIMIEVQDTLLNHVAKTGYIQLSLLNADACFDNVKIISLVPEPFTCGDCNSDDAVDISDAVYIINYAFGGGPAPNPQEAGDANCDLIVDISDAIYIINYAFAPGSPAPCQFCQ